VASFPFGLANIQTYATENTSDSSQGNVHSTLKSWACTYFKQTESWAHGNEMVLLLCSLFWLPCDVCTKPASSGCIIFAKIFGGACGRSMCIHTLLALFINNYGEREANVIILQEIEYISRPMYTTTLQQFLLCYNDPCVPYYEES